MEGTEGSNSSEGTRMEGEESPNNHLVSAASVEGIMPGMVGTKSRGRPRKYGPDGISPMPISSSMPPPMGEQSAEKRRRGRPPGSLNKQKKRMAMDNLGELGSISNGSDFIPHVINVAAGEDVMMKIMSLSQQGSRAICILSANGAIANATISQSDSFGGTLTYEGRFEILSLSGSFMPTEIGRSRSQSGGMSISLASPDGHLVGGSVAGLLIAASPVQIVVGSFLPWNQPKQKPKKRRTKSKLDAAPTALTAAPTAPTVAPTAAPTAAVPLSSVEMEGQSRQGQRSFTTPNSNLGASSSFHGGDWTSLDSMKESRNLDTDINVSLSEG